MSIVGPRPLMVKYLPRYNEHQARRHEVTVYDLDGNIIGMRGIYNVTNDSAESGRTIGYGDAFQNMEALILGIDFAFDILGVAFCSIRLRTNSS